MSKGKDKDLYLKMYPESKKWLNQCVICQSIGYKPDMPQKIYPGYLAENLRSLLSPLQVNGLSICEQCEQYLEDENHS